MKRFTILIAAAVMLLAILLQPVRLFADSWERVTSISTLTDGGTFIMGYEATAKSGVIVPLRSKDCNATTSANGYFNTGTTDGSSTDGTINMSNLSGVTTSDYEIYITASSTNGYINIQRTDSNGNFYGATSGGTTSNKGRLYTSGNSNETNLLPEWASETNNQFKLSANVSGSYKYLKYNTGSPRFAFYNSEGEKIVFYKKVSGVSPTSTRTYSFAGANNFYTDSNLTTHPSYGNGNNVGTIYYSDGKSFVASGTSRYFSDASSGYFMLGKTDAAISLPTFSGYKITKVTIHSSTGHSTSVSVSIVSGSYTASTAQTWSTKDHDYEYNISSTYQSSALSVKVTNNYNSQFTSIKLTLEAIPHTVTGAVNPVAGGEVTIETTSLINGATTDIAATANSGWGFHNWTVSGTGASVVDEDDATTTFTMGTTDATVTANFWPTITYSATNGSIAGQDAGSNTVNSGDAIEAGSTITLTAAPSSGYTFSEWSVSGTGASLESTSNNPTTLTMGSAPTTVTATFVESSGYITVSPTSATPTCKKQDIDFSISTDQTLDDDPTVFYTTSAGTSLTTAPDWIDEALYYDGTLTVSIKQNKTSSARTAYFKVEKGSVKSDVITITQSAFTLPAPSFYPVSGTTIINADYVLLESDTTGVTIRYTMGANPDAPTTSTGTVYDPEEGIAVDENTTIKAIAVKYGIGSSVATASYTVVNPLSTMDAIYTASATANTYYVTLGNWVVSGVSGKTSYVTDNQGKGFIAFYNSDSGTGFAVNNILSGTVQAALTRYNGAAEFTNLTTSTTNIGVATGGTITPITNKTIADLSGVCTGGVYTLSGLTYDADSELLSDGSNTIKPFNQLYGDMEFDDEETYNVTGVYVQYGDTKEILPRSSADIVVAPGVTASVTSISNFTYNVDGGPDVKNFTVSGANLTANISVATNSENFEISSDGSNWQTSAISISYGTGTVSATTIYVRLKSGLSSNTYSGKITVSSTGAVSKEIALTGTVTHVIAYNTSLPTGCSVSSEPNGAQVYDESVSVSATEGTGYKFSAWDVYKTGESSTKVPVTNNTFTMPDYNVTVSATFVEAYSVTYDGNGATGGTVPVDANSPYVPNATVTVSGNIGSLVKTGYDFSGWNTAANGSGTPYSAGGTFNITESTTLYAQWTAASYNVALSSVANVDLLASYGDEEEIAEGADADVAYGTEITLSATNVTAGKVFIWSVKKQSDNSDVTDDVLNGDVLTVPAYAITIGGQVAELYYKYSGDLTEGDYIIANGSNAMKNTLNSKRFNRQSISPSNNQIIVADASAYLWHIASSGDYWTIYNAAEEKYAVSTGVASQIDLGGNSDDKCLFSVSGTTTYTIVSKYNTDQKVNATLRDGGTYWACYGSGTANTLYKKAVGSKHAVAIAAGITNGNPSASPSSAYEGQTVALTPSPSDGYMLESWDVYKTGDTSTKVTVKNNSFVMPGYDVTVSATYRVQHTYTLVDGSDVTLVPGKHYIIASTNSTNYYVMGAQNDNVRSSVLASLSGSKILEHTDFYEVVISGSGTSAEPYTMYSVRDEGYMYSTGASKANIGTREDNVTTNPTYGQWTISISSGTATITSKAESGYTDLEYNHNGGSNPRFACYSSGQTAVKLYVRDGDKDLEFHSPTTIASATIAADETYIVEKDQKLTITTLTNKGDENNLIIEDGGQLITSSTGVKATVKKEIHKATAKDATYWYAISSAVADPNIESATNLITETSEPYHYDLYRFNETINTTTPWENYRAHSTGVGANFTTLERGRGYIYRNANNLSIAMTGEVNVENFDYPVTKTESGVLAGFNLIGNPYSHDIYKGAETAIPNGAEGFLRTGFYYMEPTTGKWTTGTDGSTVIKPNEAILVQTDKNGYIEMKNTNSNGAKYNNDNIMFKVANSQYSDEAYAWFGKGRGLNKISHRNAEVPMLYIRQDGEDYAIATMGDETKVFSLNFKATATGKYTLSYKTRGEFSYLHVIDRFTGEDVDMLLEGEYSFVASPIDSDARFIVKLAYLPDYGDGEGDVFAYQNGSDIFVSGEGELQIFDVMGRFVMSERINGVKTMSADDFAKGVYIFRLNEKTQKIIIK